MRLFSMLFFLAITSIAQAQWTDAGNFSSVPTNFKTIFPINQNLVYATTIDKIFKSTNGGSSWSEVYTGGLDFYEDIYFKNGNYLRLVLKIEKYCNCSEIKIEYSANASVLGFARTPIKASPPDRSSSEAENECRSR